MATKRSQMGNRKAWSHSQSHGKERPSKGKIERQSMLPPRGELEHHRKEADPETRLWESQFSPVTSPLTNDLGWGIVREPSSKQTFNYYKMYILGHKFNNFFLITSMEISKSAHLQECMFEKSCNICIPASSSCSPPGSLVEASSPSACWVLRLCLILHVRVTLFSTYTRSLASKYHLSDSDSPIHHPPETSALSFKCLVTIIAGV